MTGGKERAIPTGSSPSVSRSRRWFVFGLLAAMLLGHAWVFVEREERWPLSPYPMYSRQRGQLWTQFVVNGIDAEGRAFELATPLAPRTISINTASNTELREHPADSREIAALVRGVALAYEANRARFAPDAPRLAGVELSRLRWGRSPDDRWRAVVLERETLLHLDVLDESEASRGRGVAQAVSEGDPGIGNPR